MNTQSGSAKNFLPDYSRILQVATPRYRPSLPDRDTRSARNRGTRDLALAATPPNPANARIHARTPLFPAFVAGIRIRRKSDRFWLPARKGGGIVSPPLPPPPPPGVAYRMRVYVLEGLNLPFAIPERKAHYAR